MRVTHPEAQDVLLLAQKSGYFDECENAAGAVHAANNLLTGEATAERAYWSQGLMVYADGSCRGFWVFRLHG